MEVLIWLKNTILVLVFANIVFYKREMLQIYYAECIESMLDMLSYPESTVGPGWAGNKFAKCRFSEA